MIPSSLKMSCKVMIDAGGCQLVLSARENSYSLCFSTLAELRGALQQLVSEHRYQQSYLSVSIGDDCFSAGGRYLGYYEEPINTDEFVRQLQTVDRRFCDCPAGAVNDSDQVHQEAVTELLAAIEAQRPRPKHHASGFGTPERRSPSSTLSPPPDESSIAAILEEIKALKGKVEVIEAQLRGQ